MINKSIKHLLFFVVFLLLSVSFVKADGRERILNFKSAIYIDTLGKVSVMEHITFNVTGESINRGIVRTIPIFRKDIYERKTRVDINILAVAKDGVQEPFSTRQEGSDFAIYIGNENVRLSPGIYDYSIIYESSGHVGFFDDYDELYWNVTGNDWAFPIDEVSATIRVPHGAKLMDDNACYTGLEGSTASDCNYKVENDSTITFYAKKLSVGEGLTVATSFTPFIINRPPPPSKYEVFWNLNGTFILLFGSMLFFSFYFQYKKKKYGTKFRKPVVVPTFNPPEGKSPAIIRYLFKKKAKVDAKTLTATILSMAVKNVITIQNKNSNYTILKKGEAKDLSLEEKDAYDKLFSGTTTSVKLNKGYSSVWEKVYNSFGLNVILNGKLSEYFPDKAKLIKKGVLLSLLFIFIWFVSALIQNKMDVFNVFSICGLSLFTIVSVGLCLRNIKQSVFTAILFFVLMVVPAIFIQVSYCIADSNIIFRESFLFIYMLAFYNSLFAKKLNLTTKKGLKFTAEVEGLKMYLKTAEEKRLNFLTPPEETPAQFEKMLPYAVALDLEIEWAKKFSNILKKYDYQPTWCEGAPIVSYTIFTRSLSRSLTASMVRNVTKPPTNGGNSSGRGSGGSFSGSRSWGSGSRGGGFSGGGGGGGGGRGW